MAITNDIIFSVDSNGGTVSDTALKDLNDYYSSYGVVLIDNITLSARSFAGDNYSGGGPLSIDGLVTLGTYSNDYTDSCDGAAWACNNLLGSAIIEYETVTRNTNGTWTIGTVRVNGSTVASNVTISSALSGNSSASVNGAGFNDSVKVAFGITYNTTQPAEPTVTFEPTTVPTTIDSGVTYRPKANGYSAGGYLVNILIDKSTDNQSSWIPWAHDGFAATTSHTNNGNDSVDSGSGDTIVYWRAIATDQFGRTSTVIDDVNVNAAPTVSFTVTPGTSVTKGDTGSINAQGADVDTLSWGWLTNVELSVQVNGGGYAVLTSKNRGDSGFPDAGYNYTFNTAGTVDFRARSTDANGATSDYIYYGVTVSEPPSPSPTPTPSVTPSVTPSLTPSISVTPSVTPSVSIGASPSVTPTPTVTPTVTPSISVTPSVTPTPFPTPSVTPTVTPSSTPGASVTPTPSVTPSVTITPSLTPTPTPTPSVTPSPGVLAVYTPWVYSPVGTPVWVQTVYPESSGFPQYKVNWGDGTDPAFYYANATTNNFLLYTYTTPASAETYYTIVVEGAGGVGAAPRTLTDRFYIKNTTPTYDPADYYDPVTTSPVLPYSLSSVLVGSNEWAVADVINQSFNKISENFEYLKNICTVLKLNNSIPLVEWCAQWKPLIATEPASSYAWKTQIPGLDFGSTFTQYDTGSATGIADGIIKGIKSYRYRYDTAPDYYLYLVFSGNGSDIPDHIQIRTNGYYNSLVLSATSIGTNIPSFASVSAIDVIGTDLYVLDVDTVYRLGLDVDGQTFTIYNQVGGVSGTKDFNSGFDGANEVRTYDNNAYVSDSNNSCIKVYNSALSWIKTLYVDALSAYSMEHIAINIANGNVFALGKTFAPVAPVLTNVTLVSSFGDNTIYTITFKHDGERLTTTTSSNTLSSFALYGALSGSSNYTELTSAVMLSATFTAPYSSSNQTVTYVAASGLQYGSFKIQALGEDNFNSDLSNDAPSPDNIYYTPPYKMFEINFDSELINSFELPSNTTYVMPNGNIQSTTNINEMIIDPTGSFLYFVTDDYIYKYLTDGTALNRLTFPSAETLGGTEKLRTAFIDDRLNFFVTTDKRVFKFVDIPDTLDVYDTTLDTAFTPTSSVHVNKDEFIQDWVYNKSLLRLIENHEVLYKAIKYKYNINLDFNGNLILQNSGAAAFTTGLLSSTDIAQPVVVTPDYFIHANEFVTAAVVNRTLTKLYNLQTAILQLAAPRITQDLPTYTTNTI